jgi:hypothetical protein
VFYRIESFGSHQVIKADSAAQAVNLSGYSRHEITALHQSPTSGAGSIFIPVSKATWTALFGSR